MSVADNVREVGDLVRRFNDIDLNRRILKLEDEVLELSRDKRRADERIEELERALRFGKELALRDGLYWLEGDDTPFCTGCWDAERLAIRLKRLPLAERGHRLECPHCKTLYSHRTGI
jgi:hypothetical protein